MRTLLLLVALTLVAAIAAGCGSDEDADDTIAEPTSTAAPAEPAAPAQTPANTATDAAADPAGGIQLADQPTDGTTAPGTELTISIWPQGPDAGEPTIYTLTCDPVGGTLPDPEAACLAIQNSADMLTPIPEDAVCTMQYGGPQTAKIEGRILFDIAISADFAYTNGCEIDRWEAASALLPLPQSTTTDATTVE